MSLYIYPGSWFRRVTISPHVRRLSQHDIAEALLARVASRVALTELNRPFSEPDTDGFSGVSTWILGLLLQRLSRVHIIVDSIRLRQRMKIFGRSFSIIPLSLFSCCSACQHTSGSATKPRLSPLSLPRRFPHVFPPLKVTSSLLGKSGGTNPPDFDPSTWKVQCALGIASPLNANRRDW